MLNQKITFDLFIRGLIWLALGTLSIFLLIRLGGVLTPFFVAWLLAYMLYPVVCFMQYKLRLRNRVLCIVLALLLLFAFITGILVLVVPPTVSEFHKAQGLLGEMVSQITGGERVMDFALSYLQQHIDGDAIVRLAERDQFADLVKLLLSQSWNLLSGTINVAVGVLSTFVILLYAFFILLDYELICDGWANLIPASKREFAVTLMQDVKRGMNAYFRGQSLIAFIVGILFSIGFLIIDFPFAIGLGLLIGVLNLVPYLQTLAFLPAVLLALLKSAETGSNFWLIMLGPAIVFIIVQGIQDLILTPRIMGKAMGLNPAIILLSLSVWGSLLGGVGLIVALPLTTLLLSYYKRYVLGESPAPGILQNQSRTKHHFF